VISRKLRGYDENGNLQELQTVVEFTIVSVAGSVDSSKMQTDEAVAQSNAAIDQIKPLPSSLEHASGLVDDSVPAYNNIEPIAVTWGPFLQKVELITRIVDKISEV
jgi:transcriptional regulator with AAA-type ATPase domain